MTLTEVIETARLLRNEQANKMADVERLYKNEIGRRRPGGHTQAPIWNQLHGRWEAYDEMLRLLTILVEES